MKLVKIKNIEEIKNKFNFIFAMDIINNNIDIDIDCTVYEYFDNIDMKIISVDDFIKLDISKYYQNIDYKGKFMDVFHIDTPFVKSLIKFEKNKNEQNKIKL